MASYIRSHSLDQARTVHATSAPPRSPCTVRHWSRDSREKRVSRVAAVASPIAIGLCWILRSTLLALPRPEDSEHNHLLFVWSKGGLTGFLRRVLGTTPNPDERQVISRIACETCWYSVFCQRKNVGNRVRRSFILFIKSCCTGTAGIRQSVFPWECGRRTLRFIMARCRSHGFRSKSGSRLGGEHTKNDRADRFDP